MDIVLEVVLLALWIYFYLLLFRLVMQYVRMFARSWEPRGVMLVIMEATWTVTDPPLKALKKVIPPLRLGGIQLDMSFLVLMVIIVILTRIVGAGR